MGWLFRAFYSKEDIIRDLVKPWDNEKSSGFTIKKSCVGNVLWVVHSHTKKATNETTSFIACYLLGCEKGYGWGYKDMEESMHPYYYSCPLCFLKLAPVACQEWRNGVIKYHQRKNRLRKLTIGQVVQLSNCKIPEVKIVSLKPLLGVYNGVHYKIPKKYIA